MKRVELTKLREKTVKELVALIVKKKSELNQGLVEKADSQKMNLKKIRGLKKEIAQILTILSEKKETQKVKEEKEEKEKEEEKK